MLLITLTMALSYSSIPISHDGVTASQHAQCQYSETKAVTWNSAITNSIIYTCAFTTVTCENVFSEKGLFIAGIQLH